jgi:hypothetical protein
MYDDFLCQAKFKEMLRQAERERLVRQALAGRPARPGLFRQGRAWLARRMSGGVK